MDRLGSALSFASRASTLTSSSLTVPTVVPSRLSCFFYSFFFFDLARIFGHFQHAQQQYQLLACSGAGPHAWTLAPAFAVSSRGGQDGRIYVVSGAPSLFHQRRFASTITEAAAVASMALSAKKRGHGDAMLTTTKCTERAPDPSSFSSGSLTKAELKRLVGVRLSISPDSTGYVLEHVQHGATVPFLARYRKDETGHLDEDTIRRVIDTAEEVREVHRRRQFMLKSLEQRGLLTDELRVALERMVHLSQLEDAWEPFKERKTSLAFRGREAGLGPAASLLLYSEQNGANLQATVRKVKDGEKLLIAIISEEMQRCEEVRQDLLGYCRDTTLVKSELIEKARKKKAKEMRDADFDRLKQNFTFYHNKSFPVRRLNSHTVLALFRGEERGALKVDLVPGQRSHALFMAKMYARFPGLVARLGRDTDAAASRANVHFSGYERKVLKEAVENAYEHLIKATHTTIRRDLRKSAEQDAIAVFAHNLRHMLLQRPLAHARLLAMDPGLSNGVKCVSLDENGSLLNYFTCTLMDEAKMRSMVAQVVEEKRLNRIVIGNGTASQRTAELVASVIKQRKLDDVEFAIVSEAGASVYSASGIAKEEFPALDIMYRGAVSIGRRVLDPLSELVKIPVRSMGIGMYQHDVNEKELTRELDRVVESCVAKVGVNTNSASRYVVEKVSGVNGKLADQIVLARHSRRLQSRADLRRVPGMTEAAFLQVAGFFRFPNSPEPLDNTYIHPESYKIAKQVIALYQHDKLGHSSVSSTTTSTDTVATSTTMSSRGSSSGANAPKALSATMEKDAATRKAAGQALLALSDTHMVTVAHHLNCGVGTLKMVGEELLHPALDPRASLSHAGFLRKEIRNPANLKLGDTLDGLVQSVTTFGAFVDCGLHDAVLVRGAGADQLQVGMLVHGLRFDGLDNLKRVKVLYDGGDKSGDGGDGRARKQLRLEADDSLYSCSTATAAASSDLLEQESVFAALPSAQVQQSQVSPQPQQHSQRKVVAVAAATPPSPSLLVSTFSNGGLDSRLARNVASTPPQFSPRDIRKRPHDGEEDISAGNDNAKEEKKTGSAETRGETSTRHTARVPKRPRSVGKDETMPNGTKRIKQDVVSGTTRDAPVMLSSSSSDDDADFFSV